MNETEGQTDERTDERKKSERNRKLAEVSVGVPNGHVPGHRYHDVDCEVYAGAGTAVAGDGYRVRLTEKWGSAQGYDEEHGRRQVSARGTVLARVMDEASRSAEVAGMDMSWVVQAVSQALDEIEGL